MFNQEISFKLGQEQKYQNFIKWCKENGAFLSDEVLYPSAFGEQGFTGVSAQCDIPANKIIIAIPNKLIITHDKVIKSELGQMFTAHKQFFDEQVTSDAEFNCLAIYIFYHKLQGEKSFWHPYLEVVEQHTMFEWRNRNLFNLQDQAVIDEFMHVQQEMDATWYKFKGLLNKYPQFFGALTEHHKDTFYWSNEFVMTRCFGWTLPSTSLVPLADMLNHSTQNPATYHLVKRNFEQSGQAHLRYTLKRERIDMSLIQVQSEINPKYSIKNSQDSYIQTNSELLIHKFEGQTNREKINQINYHVLKLWKEKQAWELDYESSSQSEDNDTDSDDEEKSDVFLQIKKKEMKIIEQRKNKTEQLNTIKCSEIITSIIPKNTQYKQTQAQIKGKKYVEQESSESGSESSSDDSEKDFDWYEDDDNEVYFCMTTAGPISKGEQIYTFYGRRNNRFLLLWYGFTTKNNKYNSYNFRLWLNPDPMPMNDQIYQKLIITNTININHIKKGMINDVPLNQISRQIKLKGSKLQEDLIIYMRLFLMAYYCGKDANSVLLTIPVSVEFEIQVFDFTLKLLSYIAQKFKTSYSEDVNLNEQQLSGEEVFALNYRLGQKELVLLQINHIIEALQLLRMLKENSTLNIKEYFMTQANGIEKMRALRYYIQYLYFLQVE